MCGIIGSWIMADVNKYFDKLEAIYKNQDERGKEGSGVVIMRKGKFTRYRNKHSTTIIDELKKEKIWKPKKNDIVLFHHRIPTSTGNTPKANHPIRDEHKNIYLIHNGIITNANDLYKELTARGHKFETLTKVESALLEGSGKLSYYYHSFTDTEVLVHLLEEKLKETNNDVQKAIEYVVEKAKGSYAIAFLIRGHEKIYLFRYDNPIEIFKDEKDNLFFASKTPSDAKAIKDLENGELGYIEKNQYVKIADIKVPDSRIIYCSSSYSQPKHKNNICEIKKDMCDTVLYYVLKFQMEFPDAVESVQEQYEQPFSKKNLKKMHRRLEQLMNNEKEMQKFLKETIWVEGKENKWEECNDYDDDDFDEFDYCEYCGRYGKCYMDGNGVAICKKCKTTFPLEDMLYMR